MGRQAPAAMAMQTVSCADAKSGRYFECHGKGPIQVSMGLQKSSEVRIMDITSPVGQTLLGHSNDWRLLEEVNPNGAPPGSSCAVQPARVHLQECNSIPWCELFDQLMRSLCCSSVRQ